MIERLKADAPVLAALVVLSLVSAAGLGRLFTTPAPLAAILTAVLLGHGLAAVCRYRDFSGPLTMSAVAVAALLCMVWLVVPGTTLLGIPTGESFSAISQGLREAREQFNVAIAPTAPSDGFTMACVGAVMVLAALADWGAFRIRATIEATIPAFTVFVFAAVLGTTTHRALATFAFAAALAGWFVAHNASVIGRTRPWFTGTAVRGRRALSQAGVGVTAIALLGTTLGLAVPFTKDPPAVAWRNKNQSTARTTVSPLVDIRTRLVARSNVVAFTVSSPVRAYWRLTSLDDFNGRIWSSKGNYSDVDSGKSLKDRTGPKSTQQYAIADLKSIWLPVAYRPASTPSLEGISYDEEADAFITENETSDGLVYQVSSAVRELTPDSLRAAGSGKPDDGSGLAVPRVDPRVRELAAQIVRGQTTAYDKALAIQNYLRSGAFTYDLNVEPGHGGDEIARFLFVTRRGYCEQFAGTYALLARLAGLPTRVAVGFTPGESDGAGNYTVRELNAHAWPEVYLGRAGWIAFEPTPGRGIPGAESYTGAVESQADTTQPGVASTAVPTTAATAPGGEEQGGGTTTTQAPAAPDRSGAEGRSWLRILALAVVGLATIAGLVAAVPVVMARRRARRWADAADAAQRVLVAWNETNEALRFAGARVRISDTPVERVAAADAVLGDGGVATLERLAAVVDVATYAPPRLSDADAQDARVNSDEVRRLAFGSRSRWQQFRYAIDPRRLRR